MCFCLRLCLQEDGGFYIFNCFFLIAFFQDPSKQQLQALFPPPHTLWTCVLLQWVKPFLTTLIWDCCCSICPKPGFPKWENMNCKAAIADSPRKENPFSAAAHWDGSATASPITGGLGSVMTHGTLMVVFRGRRNSFSKRLRREAPQHRQHQVKVRGIYFIRRHEVPHFLGAWLLAQAGIALSWVLQFSLHLCWMWCWWEGLSPFLPKAFFCCFFNYSIPFLQNTESFSGWQEELDTFLSILGGR